MSHIEKELADLRLVETHLASARVACKSHVIIRNGIDVLLQLCASKRYFTEMRRNEQKIPPIPRDSR